MLSQGKLIDLVFLLSMQRVQLTSANFFKPVAISWGSYAGSDPGANNPVGQVWAETQVTWEKMGDLES